MRKLLVTVAAIAGLSLGIGGLWLFAGPHLALLADKWAPAATTSQSITSIVYEGDGTGGVLRCNGIELSLNNCSPGLEPNVGTTKDGQLALSFGGEVFPFGKLRSETNTLVAEISAADRATISTRHGVLSWPNPLGLNFMTGNSPSWKRHSFQQLTWTKPSGAKLEMLWRYEQHFLPGNGWTEALMIAQGAPGLIRVDISGPAR